MSAPEQDYGWATVLFHGHYALTVTVCMLWAGALGTSIWLVRSYRDSLAADIRDGADEPVLTRAWNELRMARVARASVILLGICVYVVAATS